MNRIRTTTPLLRSFPKVGVLALCSALALGNKASADPSYTAQDIVDHFSSKKKLGSTRALCIGTETECSKAIPERPKAVDGFDLRVNFDYNSDRLTQATRANLDEFVRALQSPALSTASFLVEGHTDGMGSDSFNIDLSRRRASAVVEYLTTHGVPQARLEAKGYGKLKPLVADPMSSENRRVETRIRDR